MPVPSDVKEQVIYHTIMSDLHRLRATTLNLQAIDAPDTAEALREHFGREQNLLLSRLGEWRLRRPDLYESAGADFRRHTEERTAAEQEGTST